LFTRLRKEIPGTRTCHQNSLGPFQPEPNSV
jgi:hypothetical protein